MSSAVSSNAIGSGPWRRLTHVPAARIGGVLVLLIIVVAVAAPWVTLDPLEIDTLRRLQPPGVAHWFGTDELGRDVFARVAWGARFFILTCVTTFAVSAGIGVPLGLAAGSGPAWLDTLLMRLVDVLLSFPYILLVLAIVAILGPNPTTAVVAVGVATVPGYARLVRGEALSLKKEEYVEALYALGANTLQVVRRAILPNVTSSLIVYASLVTPLSALAAAALSYLGLGAQPPTPEWGAMLVSGRGLLLSAWWCSTAPGMAIFVAVLSLNLLGNALRDVFDPRSSLGSNRV